MIPYVTADDQGRSLCWRSLVPVTVVTTRALEMVLGAIVTSTRSIRCVYVHRGTICRLKTPLPSANVSQQCTFFASLKRTLLSISSVVSRQIFWKHRSISNKHSIDIVSCFIVRAAIFARCDIHTALPYARWWPGLVVARWSRST